MRPAHLLLTVAVLAACGSSAGSDPAEEAAAVEEAVADALEETILDDPAFAPTDVTPEGAACVADQAVEAIGVDRLGDLGMAEGDADLGELTDVELGHIGEAMDRCVPAFEDFLVDAIVAGMLAEPNPQFPVTEAQARCVAATVAEDLGPARLIVIGVRADAVAAMDEDESQAFAGAMFDCLDVRAVLMAGIAGAGVPEDVLHCLDDEITDDDLRRLFADAVTGNDAGGVEDFLDPAVDACT